MKKAPPKNLNVRYEYIMPDPANEKGDRRELERVFDMIFDWVLENDAVKVDGVEAQNKTFPGENDRLDNSVQLGISLNHEDSHKRGNRKTTESAPQDGRKMVGEEDPARLQTRQREDGLVARTGGRAL